MRVLDSWGKTKDFFERKNFSMFSLVTLKAIKTSAWQIIVYSALPFLVMVANQIMFKRHSIIFHMLTMYLCIVIFMIIVNLALRPSTLRKDLRYYCSYWKHSIFLLLCPLWTAFGILFFLLFFNILEKGGSIFEHIMRNWYMILLLFVSIAFLIAYTAFTTFFFLDSRATFTSFIKAHILSAKMLVYNLPVCALVTIILEIVWIIWGLIYIFHIDKLINFEITLALGIIIFLLFVPVIVSVLSNLYIKFLHEQADVYFDQPK